MASFTTFSRVILEDESAMFQIKKKRIKFDLFEYLFCHYKKNI